MYLYVFSTGYKSFADGLNNIIKDLNDSNEIVDDIYEAMTLSDREFNYVGIDYIAFINNFFDMFNNRWRGNTTPKTALESIYILFGLSGYGKTRAFDELSKKYSNINVLSVSITFNDFMGMLDKNNLKTELVIRILFSIFIKKKEKFDKFRDKYFNKLKQFEDEIDWIIVLNFLKTHFKENHNGMVILCDELSKTGDNNLKIDEKLYRFLIRGINETSNNWSRKDLGIIFSAINCTDLFVKRTNSNRPLNVSSLGILKQDDIETLTNDNIVNKIGNNVILEDKQLELLLRLSQGKPRIVTELLYSKAFKIDLFETAMEFTCDITEELFDYSLSMSNNKEYYGWNDYICGNTVSEHLSQGTIIQPPGLAKASVTQNTRFKIIPCLLGVFKFINLISKDSGRIENYPIFYPINKKINNIVPVNDGGYEFEEYHFIFDSLRRDYFYRQSRKDGKLIDIDFGNNNNNNNNNIKCCKLSFEELYSSNAMYLGSDNNFGKDVIFLPQIRDIAYHYKRDFKDYNFNFDFNNDGIKILDQCHTFINDNEGFDTLFFGLNNNKDVIAFFIENKYSRGDGEGKTLKKKKVIHKHELLQKNILNHKFIKDYYHIFVTTWKIQKKETYLKTEDIDFHNVCIIGADELKSYYGPCWSNITNYFDNMDKKTNIK